MISTGLHRLDRVTEYTLYTMYYYRSDIDKNNTPRTPSPYNEYMWLVERSRRTEYTLADYIPDMDSL